MKYSKPSLTFEQQADKLLSRGFSADKDQLISRLSDVNYFRLSGYWYPFLKNDTFTEKATLDTVWDTYVFDRHFRLIVFDAIERVEIYMRTRLALELSQSQGAFGFQQRVNLPNLDDIEYKEFIGRATKAYKSSREKYIIHFKRKYGDRHSLPPYWILVEILDFGQMYRLYQGAPNRVRKVIAEELNITASVLDSWLKTLNVIRNVCAHHARLWNKVLGVKPIIPKKDLEWHRPRINNDKMFVVLTILNVLLKQIAPSSSWNVRLFELFDQFPSIPKRNMGFLPGWEQSALWQ